MRQETDRSEYRNLADERRMSTRMRKEPDSEFAAILNDHGDPLLAEVYDESLGGLCLILEDITAYPIDREVGILYQSTFLSGIVRHIEARTDGRFFVGFACRGLE